MPPHKQDAGDVPNPSGNPRKKRVPVVDPEANFLALTTEPRAVRIVEEGRATAITLNGQPLLPMGQNDVIIIRLNRFVDGYSWIMNLWCKYIFARDHYTCQYCGSRGNREVQLTIEHMLPLARGGTDQWENLVTACFECNNKKGNRTIEEAFKELNMQLLSTPKPPNDKVAFYIGYNAGSKVERMWNLYQKKIAHVNGSNKSGASPHAQEKANATKAA